MHRVELKVYRAQLCRYLKSVPNAPCGVESSSSMPAITLCSLFLMHRVELKDPPASDG